VIRASATINGEKNDLSKGKREDEVTTQAETSVSVPIEDVESTEEFKYLTLGQLAWRKFFHNKIAVASGVFLILIYLMMIFAEFVAPYNMTKGHTQYLYSPPQKLRFIDEQGNFSLRPFVYPITGERDLKTFQFVYTEDRSTKAYVYFFVEGDPYKYLGMRANRHLFGVKEDEGTLFLFGTDVRGRDQLSRIVMGSRISLTLGLAGVMITLFLGTVIGTLSGYLGGAVDNVIQRVIEFIRSFPTLPLWMALSTALPPDWPSHLVYLGIVVVLAFIGWTGLAREVRGKILSLRSTDFVLAAQATGASTKRLVFVHMIPSVSSHIMVVATLAIPGMILGESALSFLGLGIKPPLTSWGLLLSQAQKVEVMRLYPWMLTPGIFIFFVVLAYNFLGDGLRDAIDPFA
jgi:peptide/nickel transport system permease protein